MKLNLQSQSYSCEVQTQTDDLGGVLCYPLLSASQGASNDGWGLSFRYAHVTREPDKKNETTDRFDHMHTWNRLRSCFARRRQWKMESNRMPRT